MIRKHISKIQQQIPHIPKLRLIGGCITLILLLYIVYSVYGKNSEPSDLLYTGDPYTVTYGDINETLAFDGTTSFADSQKLTFGQQGLKVTQVLVQLGDKVRKNQILATLESTDVDANFKTAQSNLSLAKLNYEKTLGSQDRASDLLKAQNDLLIAQNNLQNIDTTIKLTNQEEDNNIEKAKQVLTDAQKDYDDLLCTDTSKCLASNSLVRNKKNTYIDAIENLRSTQTTIQNSIDALDKIMFFSDKYRMPSSEASIYIGANDKSTINQTSINFMKVLQQLNIIADEYRTLSSKNIESININELASAYNKMTTLGDLTSELGINARAMFNASVIGRGMAGQSSVMDQATIDGYLVIANNIYNTGRSISTQSSTMMNKVYDIDTSSNLSTIKQALDNAQLNVDKLLLSKKNRDANNESQKVKAQLAVNTAQLNIKAIQEGYFDTSVQSARSQLVQAQASLDQIRKRYESYQLIANFDGTVREMNIQVGDTVNTESNTYIYVENPNLVETTLELDQLDILKIQRGDEARVTLDILKGQSFSGIVSEVNTIPTIKNGKTSYIVKVLSEKPQDLTMVGGMSANVSFTKHSKQNVLVIPTTAISREQGKTFVMRENNIKQEVSIGASDTSWSEILSGLILGDRILSLVISEDQMANMGVSSKVFDPSKNPFEDGGSAGLRDESRSSGDSSN